MSQPHRRRTSHQPCSLRRQFAQAPGLPFSELLSEKQVEEVLPQAGVTYRNRIYTPVVTICMFLSQVLDPDHCCREAVSRLIAHLAASGKPTCSSKTASYCKARQRLPESVLAELTRRTGQQLHEEAPPEWRWKGRSVKVIDGSTISMPDTEANQEEYPQSRSQAPGLGFPIARIVVVFSLPVGSVLSLALGCWRGKGTGEKSLFRSLWECLEPGDVLLGDCNYDSYAQMALLQQRGVDTVCRALPSRGSDFRRGTRLGKGDHLVRWQRPWRPQWMDRQTYRSVPTTMAVREVKVTVSEKGFRSKRFVVATTLLEANEITAQDLADLYLIRWQAELNLRSLKEVMQMDVLRCQTPSMVRKEIWAHLLAYNLVRTVMAQTALEHNLLPWNLSFKGTLQTLNAFRDYLLTASARQFPRLCRELTKAISRHRVGDRPGRCEPRARKRRPKPYRLLTIPRAQARAALLGTKAVAA